MDAGVFCYPWDIVGDPAAAGRLAGLGVRTVTLAAAYHSVRAITPRHPAHRIVQAHHAASYVRIRPDAWRGRRLRPAPPSWGVPDPDPFGTAAAALRRAGLAVEAWIVLTHNTRLGLACPDLTVRNAFGDRYPYALCPAHEEVREYAATLVREVASGPYELSGLVLEACGWLGFEHGGHHDKTAADLTPADRELLSVCTCDACAPASSDAAALHAHRATVIEQMLHAVRDAAPALPLTLMAGDGLHRTGPDTGVDLAGFAPLVDAYLLKCWGDPEAALADFDAARRRTSARLLANVNILESADPEPPRRWPHADGLRIYHAGLASAARLSSLGLHLRRCAGGAII